MMNGDHHSDKLNDSIKVMSLVKILIVVLKDLNSLNFLQQRRISYTLMLMMSKGRI